MSDKGFVNHKDLFGLDKRYVEDVLTLIKIASCKRRGTKTKCNILVFIRCETDADIEVESDELSHKWRVDCDETIEQYDLQYNWVFCFRGPVGDRNEGVLAIERLFKKHLELGNISAYTMRYLGSPQFAPYFNRQATHDALKMRPGSKDDVFILTPTNFFETSTAIPPVLTEGGDSSESESESDEDYLTSDEDDSSDDGEKRFPSLRNRLDQVDGCALM